MQIRSNDIPTILDACLERMRCGESIQACLHDYPAAAEELEPLLIAAIYARTTFRSPARAPEARQAIQRRLQLAVAAHQPAQPRARAGWFGPFVLRFALALVIALLSLGGGVAAAQSSLPGSSLYPIKRASEGVRLRFAASATQRATLHLTFAAARSAEILALANDQQRMLDSGLVDDLDREYQLAWAEIRQAPADQVHDLVSRYVVERRADVRVFSAVLARANAATTLQLQRAVRLGEQSLAVVDPIGVPVPRPTPDHGGNTNGGDSGSNGTPNSGDQPPAAAEPKLTPEGKPTDADPKPTPEGKPTNTEPKATPEGKPVDAGPPATPEGKPVDAGPPATPEGKPEDKPDTSDPKPKPPPKPGRGKP
jgi:hypothetical protein